MIDLHGHAALITGSTKGVGRSIAKALAAAGADVVLHGRSTGTLADEIVAECSGHNVEAQFITGDLSRATDEAIADVFTQAIAANPDIDILVNNAGTYDDVPFLEMDLPRFERTLRLNVAAPFF